MRFLEGNKENIVEEKMAPDWLVESFPPSSSASASASARADPMLLSSHVWALPVSGWIIHNVIIIIIMYYYYYYNYYLSCCEMIVN
jgi:hypothetical protein